jgi:enoyl-[acyl-carrier protein] reductase I
VDCSQEGFSLAMDVSCHSFIRVARLAKPPMKNGGSLFTMSFYGAEKVVEHYNLMEDITFWDDFSFHIASRKAD